MPRAGCAAPAVFLSIHIEDYLKKHDTHWLHIDIASLCMRDERATGFGVALLFHVVMAYMKETGE
jgi:leucyl aminopeptidase